jgi:hypothetical protein
VADAVIYTLKPHTFDLVPERARKSITVDDHGCWVWTGAQSEHGYGRVKVGGRVVGAHRACWVWCRGAIPRRAELDHLCRNRACCNPRHMQLVTRSENVRRMWRSGGRKAA